MLAIKEIKAELYLILNIAKLRLWSPNIWFLNIIAHGDKQIERTIEKQR